MRLLKADILDRGIPWTRLMRCTGVQADTLNVRWDQRVSVALVYLTVLAMLAAVRYPSAWGAAALLASAVALLNFDLYRFFVAKRGWWFTLRVVPLHWLYFVYCGTCFVAGTLLHYLGDDLQRTGPATESAAMEGQTRHLDSSDEAVRGDS